MAISDFTIAYGITLLLIYLILYRNKHYRWYSGFAFVITGISHAYYDASSPFMWMIIIIGFMILFNPLILKGRVTQ